jgi:hypothetical protein
MTGRNWQKDIQLPNLAQVFRRVTCAIHVCSLQAALFSVNLPNALAWSSVRVGECVVDTWAYHFSFQTDVEKVY